ncbi:MAG: ATP-binding protein [Dehalococcoidia bacterium]
MESNAIRVLLVEDNPGDARLIREMLGDARGIDLSLEEVDRLETGLDRLKSDHVDVVLLDLGLPDGNGLETVIRTQQQAPGVPIVVLTGLDDEVVALDAVHAGAQDYLVKGEIESSPLARAIRYAIERKQVEEDLRRAIAELERKTELLESFTYSVSHDLKEPLRTIEAFSQFLLEDSADRLDEQGRDYLQRLTQASARMKRQIEELLTLSAIDRQPAAEGRVSVSHAVAETLEGMRFVLDQRKARVVVENELPDVQGDEVWIQQIVGNLISNALKFNESEEPFVQIGVRDMTPKTATFYVRDNGIGIDPEYHERIFGVFQRLHRREQYDGTGAGLTIARRAVEAMGGRVWVESQAGAGAVFLFSLPLWTETTAHLTTAMAA